MLTEYESKHLNVPFIVVFDNEGNKKYLCKNGVLFTKTEYMNKIDLQAEYVRREKEGTLYDYEYAKATGNLRPLEKKEAFPVQEIKEVKEAQAEIPVEQKKNSIVGILLLLGFTSLVSMYMSTLHTSTYLKDYTDIFSAWLMSASVTAYNSTAFEVGILFKNKKRFFMSFLFLILWCFVTVFSMTTTVSVFYDRFNFETLKTEKVNNETEKERLALDILKDQEKALRESIDFKKKDITYRQEKEYATATVRNELTKLEEELQLNLSEQKNLLLSTPEAAKNASESVQKEKFFTFLSRNMGVKSGILEFIMSTLAAIFINLIAPLSLSAVIELKNKQLTN